MDPVVRQQCQQYLDYARDLAEADAALSRAFRASEALATVRVLGGPPVQAKLTAWASGRVGWKAATGGAVQQHAVHELELPWERLLADALGQAPRPAAARLAFLWHWRHPAALRVDPGETAFAALLREHDRTRRQPAGLIAPIHPAGEGRVTVIYDFVQERASLAHDWAGADRIASGERGLHWVGTESLPKEARLRETQVPTVRWKGGLRAPAELRAELAMAEGSSLAIGLSDGTRCLRLLLINRSTGTSTNSPATLVWTGDDGLVNSYPSSLGRTGSYTPDRPVVVELAVAADGKLSVAIGGTPIAAADRQAPIFRFAADRPLTALISSTGRTAAAIPTLRLVGAAK